MSFESIAYIYKNYKSLHCPSLMQQLPSKAKNVLLIKGFLERIKLGKHKISLN